eukprot:3850110-Pleurochrysis_carterae.AAC.3
MNSQRVQTSLAPNSSPIHADSGKGEREDRRAGSVLKQFTREVSISGEPPPPPACARHKPAPNSTIHNKYFMLSVRQPVLRKRTQRRQCNRSGPCNLSGRLDLDGRRSGRRLLRLVLGAWRTAALLAWRGGRIGLRRRGGGSGGC